MGLKLSLGAFEEQILMAIHYCGNMVCAVQIIEKIEKATGKEISVGALYATFDRLIAKGLISFELGSKKPERGGRAMKLFSLTPSGNQALNYMNEVRLALAS